MSAVSDNRALAEALRRAGQPDPAAYLDTLTRLFRAYPRHPVDDGQFRAFAELLVRVPLLELRSVCDEWLRTQKWPPTVAELLERLAQRQMQRVGVAGSAEAAWHEVLGKLSSCGTRRIPGQDTAHGPAVTFGCAVTARIMTPEWWRQLGALTRGELESAANAFYRAWRAEASKLQEAVQCGRQLPPAPEVKRLPAPRQLPGPDQQLRAWRPEVEQLARQQIPRGIGEAAAEVLALVGERKGVSA